MTIVVVGFLLSMMWPTIRKVACRFIPLYRLPPPAATLNILPFLYPGCLRENLLTSARPQHPPHPGMLTNLTKLPLDRIHNNLKMFMSGGDNKYDKSLPELQQLLWRLCSDEKLEQVDGEYRLVK